MQSARSRAGTDTLELKSRYLAKMKKPAMRKQCELFFSRNSDVYQLASAYLAGTKIWPSFGLDILVWLRTSARVVPLLTFGAALICPLVRVDA